MSIHTKISLVIGLTLRRLRATEDEGSTSTHLLGYLQLAGADGGNADAAESGKNDQRAEHSG